MIFNPKTLKTRKWMNLLLISYQVPAMKYNGKIHDYRIKDLGLGPCSVTYSVILNILHIFHCKRKVVGQCLPHTFHLWICETPGLSCLGIPICMDQIILFSPTGLICSPFQEGGSLGEMPSWESKYIIHLVKLL